MPLHRNSNVGYPALLPINQPFGVPTLNKDGVLEGPIIGRLLLESDTTTVPRMGEWVTIVDRLPAVGVPITSENTPTRAEVRVGDDVTVKGLRLTMPIRDVTTNTAKLALTGVPVGQKVRITQEGNRIEEYLGGTINSDTSWLVIRNTVQIKLEPNSGGLGKNDLTINGTNFSYDVGDPVWADPASFVLGSSTVAYSVTSLKLIAFSPSTEGSPVSAVTDSASLMNFLTGSTVFVPSPVPLRGSVSLGIEMFVD